MEKWHSEWIGGPCHQNRGKGERNVKCGDGCHGGSCLLQTELFLHLSYNTEACHCLVRVLGLVEDKGWDPDKQSPRNLPDSVGNPDRSALTKNIG